MTFGRISYTNQNTTHLIVNKDYYFAIKTICLKNCLIYLSSGWSCTQSTVRTITCLKEKFCIIIDIFNNQQEYERLTELLNYTTNTKLWKFFDYRDENLNEKIKKSISEFQSYCSI